MTKKRQMWVQACLLWTVIWGILGFFAWPLLFMAALSASLILIPVGVDSNAQPTQRHNPDAWRSGNNWPQR